MIDMQAFSREFRVALPWELLYTDDMVMIAETEDDLIKRLNEWKDFVENRGMRVNMNKIKVMISGNGRRSWRRLLYGYVVSVIEVVVIIQYSVLVVQSGYTVNVVV